MADSVEDVEMKESDGDVVMASSSSSSSSSSRKKSSSSSSSSSKKPAHPLFQRPKKGKNLEEPWLEKYRPRILKDIVGNQETITRLKVIAKDGNMPNMIISGPPGTGKTTSIGCLAHEMLGDSFKAATIELNASDDRGIDVVRNKIKMFAQNKVSLPPGKHKIIILDEADNMTPAAQQALRRTMELYSNTTRFALACNISSKIIEPIQSRCAILRYNKLSDKEVLSRCLKVLEFEGIDTYTNDGLEAILFVADGDLRTALNSLQSTHAGFGSITQDNVFKVCDTPHPVAMKKILSYCTKADIKEALKALLSLWKDGYSALDIIQTLFRVTRNHDMGEEMKLKFIRAIAFTHMRISEGCDSQLQLTGLLGRLCKIALELN